MDLDSFIKEGSSPKILIVLHGAIGDVTRALPAISQIKKNCPQCHITWAVEPISKPVLDCYQHVDKVVVFNRKKGLAGFRNFISFIKEIRLSEYDIVLDMQRHFKSGVVSFFSGGKIRIGFSKENSRELNWIFNNYHIKAFPRFSIKTTQFLGFANILGIETSLDTRFDYGLEGDLTGELKAVIGEFNIENSVGMLLGSTWESRLWQIDSYVELIAKLKSDYNLSTVLIGGPSDRAMAESILSKVGPYEHVLNTTGETKLSDLPYLFSKLKLAVGSDSGPMHICAAMSTPVISLWGATSPKRSAPIEYKHLCINKNVVCSPCYKKICARGDMLCMNSITVDDVLDKVNLLIN